MGKPAVVSITTGVQSIETTRNLWSYHRRRKNSSSSKFRFHNVEQVHARVLQMLSEAIGMYANGAVVKGAATPTNNYTPKSIVSTHGSCVGSRSRCSPETNIILTGSGTYCAIAIAQARA